MRLFTLGPHFRFEINLGQDRNAFLKCMKKFKSTVTYFSFMALARLLAGKNRVFGCPFCGENVNSYSMTPWAWEKKDNKTWEWVRYITCEKCGQTGREVTRTIQAMNEKSE